MRSHVQDLIASIVKSSDGLEDDTDLFSFGLDSLAATRIRNALQRVRPSSRAPVILASSAECAFLVQGFNFGGKKLPMNFVFEQPTVSKCVPLPHSQL